MNVSSISGMRPTRGEAAYSAAKAAVIALTQSAALEYGPTLRVNCVSPGSHRHPVHRPVPRRSRRPVGYRAPDAAGPGGRRGRGGLGHRLPLLGGVLLHHRGQRPGRRRQPAAQLPGGGAARGPGGRAGGVAVSVRAVRGGAPGGRRRDDWPTWSRWTPTAAPRSRWSGWDSTGTGSSRATWGRGARCRTSGGTPGCRSLDRGRGPRRPGPRPLPGGPGRAEVVEGGAAPLLQRLAHVYLGPDVVFPG